MKNTKWHIKQPPKTQQTCIKKHLVFLLLFYEPQSDTENPNTPEPLPKKKKKRQLQGKLHCCSMPSEKVKALIVRLGDTRGYGIWRVAAVWSVLHSNNIAHVGL